MMPEKTRAESIPRIMPARTMEIEEERRWAGARSTAKGRRICGVTLETPTRNESASKTRNCEVMERPIVIAVEIVTTVRRSGRRRRRSPSGEMRTRPVA